MCIIARSISPAEALKLITVFFRHSNYNFVYTFVNMYSRFHVVNHMNMQIENIVCISYYNNYFLCCVGLCVISLEFQ